MALCLVLSLAVHHAWVVVVRCLNLVEMSKGCLWLLDGTVKEDEGRSKGGQREEYSR